MEKLAEEILKLNYQDMRTLSQHIEDSMDARSSDALGIADILVEFAESVIDGPAQDKKENAAKPDDEGWVEWRSGECPVDPDTLVDVRLRIQLDGKRAGDLFWPTIAAYRVR